MAYDHAEKKDVALKFMVLRDITDNEYLIQTEIIRCVADTSGLVTYLSTFQVPGLEGGKHRVFVFPLRGPSLQRSLILGPRMPIAARMSAAKQLLVSLNQLHLAGFVHSGRWAIFPRPSGAMANRT